MKYVDLDFVPFEFSNVLPQIFQYSKKLIVIFVGWIVPNVNIRFIS
jgi:hypothetical protein